MDTFFNHIATQQTAADVRLLAAQIRAAAAVRRQLGTAYLVANGSAQ